MNNSIRLTVGQALIRFVAKQYVERDTWWDVPVAEVSAVEKTRQTRENYEKATQKQRSVFA